MSYMKHLSKCTYFKKPPLTRKIIDFMLVLVSLLLTLNIKPNFSSVSNVDFEQVNVSRGIVRNSIVWY